MLGRGDGLLLWSAAERAEVSLQARQTRLTCGRLQEKHKIGSLLKPASCLATVPTPSV